MKWKAKKIIGQVVSGTPIMELRIDGITDRAKPTQGLSLPSLLFYTPYLRSLKKACGVDTIFLVLALCHIFIYKTIYKND